MDFATIVGIFGAVAALVLGFTIDGGSLSALIQFSSMILVLGGTLGATLVTVQLKQFIRIFSYIKIAVMYKPADPLDIIEKLTTYAQIARREGVLALDERLEKINDPFLLSGLRSAVDGVDPELVRELLETELIHIEERHKVGARMFEAAGGFAPTMGIIGTVMGLVHVLGDLTNVSKLGPQIAAAFTATLYGVSSANIFWLPIANKLKLRNHEEILIREIEIEGILSIQAGENPNMINQKLRAFLAPSERQRKGKTGEESGTSKEAAQA